MEQEQTTNNSILHAQRIATEASRQKRQQQAQQYRQELKDVQDYYGFETERQTIKFCIKSMHRQITSIQ